jgi:hypothetical protein
MKSSEILQEVIDACKMSSREFAIEIGLNKVYMN